MIYLSNTMATENTIHEDKWVDAQEVHKENPDTFEVPDSKKLENLKLGDTAKICNGEERFWVKITEINDDTIIGTVNNALVDTSKYNYEDYVSFKKTHIYDIHTEADRQKFARCYELYGKRKDMKKYTRGMNLNQQLQTYIRAYSYFIVHDNLEGLLKFLKTFKN